MTTVAHPNRADRFARSSGAMEKLSRMGDVLAKPNKEEARSFHRDTVRKRDMAYARDGVQFRGSVRAWRCE